MTDSLEELLSAARARGPMTPDEIRAQKISFAYGQLMECAPDITKAEIAAMLKDMERIDD